MANSDNSPYTGHLRAKNVVIYGLSVRAKECLGWLSARFPGVSTVGFISDMPTSASEFCGRPVLSVQYLTQNPQIAVVYAERHLPDITRLKERHSLANDFYIFYCAKPYLTTGDTHYAEQAIREIYQTQDPETGMFLDNYFSARQNGWSFLLPLSDRNRIARYNKRYWDQGDNDLGIWPALTLLDCGAYTGDSLQDFYGQYGDRLGYAYALEADTTKQSALEGTVSQLGIAGSTRIIMQGASDTAGDLYIENAGTTSGTLAAAGEHSARVLRIDDLDIEPVGKLCIKMDVEGHEMPALRGAEETIRRYTPELAICVYHQAADIYEIPAYIKTICPDYRFILRGGVHTVCYGSTQRFS